MEIITMTTTEKLNALRTARETMIAELNNINNLLEATTETVTLYAGGSRYSLAGPGDNEVIGHREVTTYKRPEYLARKIYLVNALEANRGKIRKLEEKLKKEARA
jgi:hypothetical protein